MALHPEQVPTIMIALSCMVTPALGGDALYSALQGNAAHAGIYAAVAILFFMLFLVGVACQITRSIQEVSRKPPKG